MKISLYNNIRDVKSQDKIDIDLFLDNIQGGHYQIDVMNYRNETDKDKKQVKKKKLKSVTVSGVFSERKDKSLIEHSGFICIDIDNIEDPEDVKELVRGDEYLYSAFISAGGKGLALIFKITPSKHKDAFYGLSKYLFENYKLIVDPTCINVSRARFVSHDPYLYLNPQSKKFCIYPKKALTKAYDKKVIFVKNDFDQIINEIQSRNIDITSQYEHWLRIGFAFADKLGEAGRQYYHMVSAVSPKYNPAICDKQYTNCLKHKGSGVSMGTFYHYCKEANISTYSSATKDIISTASAQLRKGGMSRDDIKTNLKEFSNYEDEHIDDVVDQVDDKTVAEDQSLLRTIQNEISIHFEPRFNEITRFYEIKRGGKFYELDNAEINGIYIQLNDTFPKVNKEMVTDVIISPLTPTFNPITSFFAKNIDKNTTGHIDKLANCITSVFGLNDKTRLRFIKKWLVGMIASVYGEHHDQFLVLAGSTKNVGKTYFLNNLLPKELTSFSSVDVIDKMSKDTELKLTKKWVFIIDELEGNFLQNINQFKALMSKNSFFIREPYGKIFKDIPRLAALCGTSNDYNIIPPDTGNRRIVPIQCEYIDWQKYNEVNKTNLIMEAYQLYHQGFKWRFDKEDIHILNLSNKLFEESTPETDLLFQYFEPSEHGDIYTSTDIVAYIESRTSQRLSIRRVGLIMSKNNIKKRKENGAVGANSRRKGYQLIKIEPKHIPARQII